MVEFLVYRIITGKLKLEDIPLRFYDDVKKRLEEEGFINE